MLRSTVGLVELREVFLTHYHADHYLGLPGMLKTFALRGREVDLTVYGPPGLADLFAALKRIFGKLTYTVRLEELAPGDVFYMQSPELIAVAHGLPRGLPAGLAARVSNRKAGFLKEARLPGAGEAEPTDEDDYY